MRCGKCNEYFPEEINTAYCLKCGELMSSLNISKTTPEVLAVDVMNQVVVEPLISSPADSLQILKNEYLKFQNVFIAYIVVALSYYFFSNPLNQRNVIMAWIAISAHLLLPVAKIIIFITLLFRSYPLAKELKINKIISLPAWSIIVFQIIFAIFLKFLGIIFWPVFLIVKTNKALFLPKIQKI